MLALAQNPIQTSVVPAGFDFDPYNKAVVMKALESLVPFFVTQFNVPPNMVNAAMTRMIDELWETGVKLGYVVTAKQLLSQNAQPGTWLYHQIARHIVNTFKNMTPEQQHDSWYHLHTEKTELDDIVHPVTDVPVLHLVGITAYGLDHIYSGGQNILSVTYRDLCKALNAEMLRTMVGMVKYKDVDKPKALQERAESHRGFQANVQGRVTKKRRGVSSAQHANMVVAHTYKSFYSAALNTSTPPREAAQGVGVTLNRGPIIQQSTAMCNAFKVVFDLKVQNLMAQRDAANDPISAIEASTLIAENEKRRGTYIQQDIDLNDVPPADQVRAMVDNTYAATRVRESSLVIAA